MGDRKITVLELHTHGNVQLGSRGTDGGLLGVVRSGEETEAETEDEAAEAEEEEGGGGVARVLVPLIALIGIAVAAKYLRGGDEDLEEVDEEEGRLERFTTTTE